MNSLLPPNASAPERAIETSIQRAFNVPVNLNQLWNPATCPAALLPWLAWSLAVDDWDEQWLTETKRKIISIAVVNHKLKGTVFSVKNALSALGVSFDFLEWFEPANSDVLALVRSTQPHTFTFVTWANDNLYTSSAIFLNSEMLATIEKVVNNNKPARSHFNFLVGARMDTGVSVGSVLGKGLQVGIRRGALQSAQPANSVFSLGSAMAGHGLAVARFYFEG